MRYIISVADKEGPVFLCETDGSGNGIIHDTEFGMIGLVIVWLLGRMCPVVNVPRQQVGAT